MMSRRRNVFDELVSLTSDKDDLAKTLLELAEESVIALQSFLPELEHGNYCEPKPDVSTEQMLEQLEVADQADQQEEAAAAPELPPKPDVLSQKMSKLQDGLQKLQKSVEEIRKCTLSLQGSLKHLESQSSRISRIVHPRIMFAVRVSYCFGEKGQVVFDEVTMNIGDGYEASTGFFHVPKRGVYRFMLESFEEENMSIARTRNFKFPPVYWGSSVILDLDKQDSVFVERMKERKVAKPLHASFSGYRLA